MLNVSEPLWPFVSRKLTKVKGEWFFTWVFYPKQQTLAAWSSGIKQSITRLKIGDVITASLGAASVAKTWGVGTYEPEPKRYLAGYTQWYWWGFETDHILEDLVGQGTLIAYQSFLISSSYHSNKLGSICSEKYSLKLQCCDYAWKDPWSLCRVVYDL